MLPAGKVGQERGDATQCRFFPACLPPRQPGVPLPPTSEIFLPTDVGEDNKMIYGIFPGKVIIVDSGKLVRMGLPPKPRIIHVRSHPT